MPQEFDAGFTKLTFHGVVLCAKFVEMTKRGMQVSGVLLLLVAFY